MTFDPTAVQHAYEAIAGQYETKFTDGLVENDFDRAILDAAIASIPRGDVVLDVGCGPAQVSVRVLGAGGVAVGIDLTPAMLGIARRHVPLMPLALTELRRVLRPGGVAVIATHAGVGQETIKHDRDGRSETVIITYYEADELATLAGERGLVPTEMRERPPLDNEHQVQKLFVTATAT